MSKYLVNEKNNKIFNGIIPRYEKTRIYSMDEQVVGTWINGKPIYKKTIEFPTFSNTTVTVNTGLTAIETLVDVGGGLYRAGSSLNINYMPLTYFGGIAEFGINKQTGVARISTTSQYITLTGYAHIYYTKTTD